MNALEDAVLDPSLPTPLYHQLFILLRERILRGAFAPAATLPGEEALARLFKVSRITVKRALNELAACGLVSRHRGRGTIVFDRLVAPVIQGSFEALMSSLQSIGLETEVQVLEVYEGVVGEAAAARLGLAPDRAVQRSVRIRSVAGAPFSHLVAYVPADIAHRYGAAELASTAILTLLARVGAQAHEADQFITAAAAEPGVAAALDVPLGTPLLKIERVIKDKGGRPIQFMVAHYRPDRFQYTVRAIRRGGGERGEWRDVRG